MELTTIGRARLRVSRVGLGCGGHSRLGLSQGHSETDAQRVVREAIDLGINFIDTAEGYGTEKVVGQAIASIPRDSLVISTKAGVHHNDERSTPEQMRRRLEECLRRLQTDYVDVFHLHGVSLDDYPYAEEVLAPAMAKWKEQGMIRAVGLTEAFAHDTRHAMLERAVKSPNWDVVMVGFNLLNPSARHRVLPACQQHGIVTLCMFAVRRALSHPEALRELVANLVASGQIQADRIDPEDPLGFLVEAGVAGSVQEAAYRFCRHEPGIDIVLTGTGNVNHLRENVRSLEMPSLPQPTLERLEAVFGSVDSVSGN